MNEKITRKHLDNLALRINIVTNSSSNQKIIGSYYIAYGSLYENKKKGYELQRTSSSRDGWYTPLDTGYITKRILYYSLCSFLVGLKIKV
jgi:hypothetical protein